MNIDQKLDTLKNIKKVDAPHFLYTRVQQQIHSLEPGTTTARWKWAFVTSLIIILILNIAVVFKSIITQKKQDNIDVVLTSLHLSNSNQLYHE